MTAMVRRSRVADEVGVTVDATVDGEGVVVDPDDGPGAHDATATSTTTTVSP
jgi:hypothetical protein